MTHEEKIKYFTMACGIVGYSFEPKSLDLLVSIYDLILEKEGKTDIDSISKVQHEINERYKTKEND